MKPIPVVRARVLIKALKGLGFVEIRSRGSHRRFAHPDGRKTTVPVHKGADIPKGLLRQIVTLDIGMSMDDFIDLL